MQKKYFINDEKGTVVAKYHYVPEISEECTNSLVGLVADVLTVNGSIYFNFNSMFGKATCVEPDEFNPVVGKDLAGVKLDRKYHKKMQSDYAKVIAELEKALVSARECQNYHSKKINNIDNDLVRHFGYDPEMLINL